MLLPFNYRRTANTFYAFFLVFIFSNGFALEQFDKSVLTRRLLRGYERYPPNAAGPVTVELGIYINYFYDISEQTMDYSVSMYLRQQWYDMRLRFNATDNNNNPRLKVGQSDIRKLWIPDVFIRNEKSASFHYVTTDNNLLYIESDGKLWYVSKITATLSCPMRLHRYPMDTQKCPLLFESFGYSSDDVMLKWIDPREKAVQFDATGKSMPQFVMNDFVLSNCTYNKKKLDSLQSFPCLEVKFVVSRNLGYYMIQYYIPSILLVILSWVGFWISVDAVVARVSIGLLTVLNLTMQSTGSRNQLPQVSYIKAIDVWMSVSLAFAFGSLLEFAIVNVWSRKEVKSKNRGHSSSYLPPAAAAAGAAVPSSSGSSSAVCPVIEQTSGRTKTKATRSESTTIESNTIENLSEQIEVQPFGGKLSRGLSRRLSKQFIQRHVEQAQNIDSLSRKLFPSAFLCFNIIYWMCYSFLSQD